MTRPQAVSLSRTNKTTQRYVKDLEDEVRRLRSVHELLQPGRDWFTIHTITESLTLFRCEKDGTHAVCSLGIGDVLLVGRAKK
jgi:hypothetical protein